MSEDPEAIIATGGICAPLTLFYPPPLKRGDTFRITIQVEGRLRRWWHRRTGWSTEWTQEHEWVPLTDSLPKFTAMRGGVEFK